MQFNIDQDRGDLIAGWVLPDNPSLEPRIIARAGGREAIVPPSVMLSNLVDEGLHDTGRCGFEVSAAALPGLAEARDVRLYDEDSGLLLYARRGPHAYAEARLFVFDSRGADTSLVAPRFAEAFHMAYVEADQVPVETCKACIELRFTTSLYVGGPVQFKAVEPFLQGRGFRLTALLADPAELLFATLMPPEAAAEPDAPRRLAAVLNRLNERQRAMLSDPLARRLTLLRHDDMLERDAVALALDALSEFDAVGVEAALPEFMALTAAVCEADERLFAVAPYRPPLELSALLRREPGVQALIGQDIEIYDAVADAILAARMTG
ncbi:hypothetical protein sos41_36630 [Alphaproteobacteria bacterium SO-S41]|nr:hypothetical protein sos41_36630 [Alphaproteobacteria bacterium SO-S41]